MSNEYFKFKRFTVFHDRCAMKVGTDGVLLGAWAPGGKKILDIGTGSGLISLMMAQRFDKSSINALEIDGEAASQAKENVEKSEFNKRIDIFHSSLQEYHEKCKTKYDCIVSNPPFYTEDTGCPENRRHTARHTESLTYSELFKFSADLLDNEGKLSVIVPYEAKNKILFEACLSGLYVKNICYIRTTPRKDPKRIMATFSKVRPDNVENEEHCIMNEDGSKSEWYLVLTRDFYL